MTHPLSLITSTFKIILKDKPKFMHKCGTDKASDLADKMGTCITKFNATSLRRCDHKINVFDPWDKVNASP